MGDHRVPQGAAGGSDLHLGHRNIVGGAGIEHDVAAVVMWIPANVTNAVTSTRSWILGLGYGLV